MKLKPLRCTPGQIDVAVGGHTKLVGSLIRQMQMTGTKKDRAKMGNGETAGTKRIKVTQRSGYHSARLCRLKLRHISQTLETGTELYPDPLRPGAKTS